jgi:serine/threonine protein phosphatase PrpC
MFLCEKSIHVEKSGSCALVCLIKNNKIYIGNVGDSRCLLISKSNIKQVTTDHKPDEKNEKLRIIRNGGKIYKDGCTDGGK